MQTNRKYLNRVYTNANKPQWIKPIRFNEAISLKVLLSNVYQKVNEIIEALPNNWPVLIDVDMHYTAKQIAVEGSVFIDFNKVLLNETLSIENDGYTGLLYVNLLNDRVRPVLEISPKFMEPNWTTLYVLSVVDGNIKTVLYNDIYAGMHESDPNAHKELFDELREYIKDAIEEFFKNFWKRLVVFDVNNDGPFERLMLTDINDYHKYSTIDIELITFDGIFLRTRLVLDNVDRHASNTTTSVNNASSLVLRNIDIRKNSTPTLTIVSTIRTFNSSNVTTPVTSSTSVGVTSESTPYIVPSRIILRGYIDA